MGKRSKPQRVVHCVALPGFTCRSRTRVFPGQAPAGWKQLRRMDPAAPRESDSQPGKGVLGSTSCDRIYPFILDRIFRKLSPSCGESSRRSPPESLIESIAEGPDGKWNL